MNGDSGSSIRSWARKVETVKDPLAAVRQAEEEERLQAEEEEQARLKAQQEQQARVRA